MGHISALDFHNFSYGESRDPDHFAKEIELNINTLADTVTRLVHGEKGIELDEGFIEILRNDIETLKRTAISKRSFDQKIVDRLENRLNALALTPIAFNQKVAEPVKLVDFADRYTSSDGAKSGAILEGIKVLCSKNPNYKVREVAGDGDCLFRSFAIGVIEQLKDKGKQEELRQFFDKSPEGSALLQEINKAKNLSSLFNNKNFDKRLVSFMRQQACEFNRLHGSESFTNWVAAQGRSEADYLADMANLDLHVWGDEPEVAALAAQFNIAVRVENLPALPTGNGTTKHGPDNAKTEVVLLFNGSHYNVGYPQAKK